MKRRTNRRHRSSRQSRFESLEHRDLLAADPFGQNPLQPLDVSRDGNVSALDALLVLNALNRSDGSSANPADSVGSFIDVNNDGRGTPLDALHVLNSLRRKEPRFAVTLRDDTARSGEEVHGRFDLVTDDYSLRVHKSGEELDPTKRVVIEFNEVEIDITDRFIGNRVHLSPSDIDHYFGEPLPRGEHSVSLTYGSESQGIDFRLTVAEEVDATALTLPLIGDRMVSEYTEEVRLRLSADSTAGMPVDYGMEVLGSNTAGDVTIDDDILTLSANPGSKGMFDVRVTASDGVSEDSRTFTVHVNSVNLDGYLIEDQLLGRWLDSNGVTGLGLPTSSAEYDDGRVSQGFENGELSWSVDEGYRIVDFDMIELLTETAVANEVTVSPNAPVPSFSLTSAGSPPVIVEGRSFSIPVDQGANAVVAGGLIGTVVANDPDVSNPTVNDVLSYAITNGDPGGAFAIDANGQITVANPAQVLPAQFGPDTNGPGLVQEASHTIDVTVTDSTGNADTASFEIFGPHTRRPTLLVLTQGASTAGHDLYNWQEDLDTNLGRDLRNAGSEVHTMFIQWDSFKINDPGVNYVSFVIDSWLSRRSQDWDVVLVGHSRGAIFNQEVAQEIAGHQNIANLMHIMLDPTAAVTFGDQYPNSVPNEVDRATVYDDGFVFVPLTVDDGHPVNGAGYERVRLPGIGYHDPYHHTALANWYAEDGYEDDLAWLLGRNPAASNPIYPTELTGNGNQIVVAPGPSGAQQVIDIGINPNENGNFHGWISTAIGGADVTIGKQGFDARAGVLLLGSAGVSLSSRGLVVEANLFNLASGGLRISNDEARIDANLLGLNVNLFGRDAGISFGGNKLTVDSDASLANAAIQVDTITEGLQTAKEVFQDGQKVIGARIDEAGQWIEQRFDAITGSLSEELRYFGNSAASQLQRHLEWTSAGTLAAINQFAESGERIVSDFVDIGGILANEFNRGTENITRSLWALGLRDTGEIANILVNVAGRGLENVAAAFKRADDLFIQGSRELAEDLAGLAIDGDELARALRFGAGLDVATIADALDDALDFSPAEIADALWGNGFFSDFGNDAAEELARVLDAEIVFTDYADDFAKALFNGAGLSVETIADVFDDGLDFSPAFIADALWGNGFFSDFGNDAAEELARVLDAEIVFADYADDFARALFDGAGLSVETIADVFDDG
ncbi:MAG: dockerin type I domain-containing protein, partial [Planctomycetota bacterium]